MKYIRKFNESIINDIGDKLYLVISSTDYHEFLNNRKRCKITDQERDFCCDLIGEFVSRYKNKDIDITIDNYSFFESDVDIDIGTDSNLPSYFYFDKYEDDWWIMRMCISHMESNFYILYIVDSVDGLKKWGDDIGKNYDKIMELLF